MKLISTFLNFVTGLRTHGDGQCVHLHKHSVLEGRRIAVRAGKVVGGSALAKCNGVLWMCFLFLFFHFGNLKFFSYVSFSFSVFFRLFLLVGVELFVSPLGNLKYCVLGPRDQCGYLCWFAGTQKAPK